jgi:hypothetical protein
MWLLLHLVVSPPDGCGHIVTLQKVETISFRQDDFIVDGDQNYSAGGCVVGWARSTWLRGSSWLLTKSTSQGIGRLMRSEWG